MQQGIERSSYVVIGANGVPLDVVGWVTANVVLGTFHHYQEFIVVTANVVLGTFHHYQEFIFVTANVVLGTFHHYQEFIVVRELTVQCLLGADFMEEHGVMIDYRTRSILLGQDLVEIPIVGIRGIR